MEPSDRDGDVLLPRWSGPQIRRLLLHPVAFVPSVYTDVFSKVIQNSLSE